MLQNKKLLQVGASAILAVGFIQFYLKEKEGAIANAYGMVEVLTAARDIPPRTALSESYITTQRVPLKYVAPGAIVVKIPTDALNRVRNKISIATIPEGSQIVQSNLMVPSGEKTGVAPLIPPGKRGYILRLGNIDVASLILPGDYIDILATFSIRRENGNTKLTHTILQNILVISVGRELRRPGEDVTNKEKGAESLLLTLALSPIETQALALAQAESQGEISVVVRPHGESAINDVPVLTPGGLFGNSANPPPAPPLRKTTIRDRNEA